LLLLVAALEVTQIAQAQVVVVRVVLEPALAFL
jgi:hypothetical protein